jgi:23S rRNA (cytidine1920-2'-O)/16S rRNA (cytidine1409-2'-O)-methyltransferase
MDAYASRGGLKLAHALREFALDVRGWLGADLGCSTGGFTDCLLRHGAAKVFAVDTAYGQLAWSLRKDPRVVVMERTNALHATPPQLVDLVVADMSWTPQRLVVPAARRWLTPGGRIISLIKPHYELKDRAARDRAAPDRSESLPRGGVLDIAAAERVAHETAGAMPALGARVLGLTRSPILGGARKGKGNAEWLVLLGHAE